MATFTWIGTSGGDWTDPANWDVGAVPGSGDIAVLPASLGSATIVLDSSVSLAALISDGGTLTLQPGVALTVTDALTLQGTIAGGTLQAQGAVVTGAGGTLSGVVVQGTLDLHNDGGSVRLADGTRFSGVTGVGPGIVLDSGPYNYLYVNGSQTLDNAQLTIGSPWGDYLYVNDVGSGAIVTLGPNMDVVDAGYAVLANDNGPASDGIVNLGTIQADVPGQTLVVEPNSFVNAGTMQAGQGGNLEIEWNQTLGWTNEAAGIISATNANLYLGADFTNLGTVSVNGGSLNLQMSPTAWSNAGVISASNAAIALSGPMQTGEVETISRTGGSISLNGSIDNTGATIDATQGVFAGLMLNSGTISGGTLIDGVGARLGANYSSSNTLSDVTVLGGLTLSGAYLALSNGTTVLNAAGTAPGAITLTNSSLELDNAGTFANSTALTASNLYFAGENTAAAQPIFATGVDASGAVLPGGAADPHWSVDVTGAQAVVLSNPYPGWPAENATGAWIGAYDQIWGEPSAPYTFTETFNLATLDPLTLISGFVAADDYGLAVINGHTITGTGWGGTNFTLSAASGWLNAGSNTFSVTITSVDN